MTYFMFGFKNKFLLIGGLVSLIFLSACEEKIEIDLDSGTSQITVDAWITNKPGKQVIKLTQSTDYFANAPSPVVLNAIVKIEDDMGGVFNFVDLENNGNYVWTPLSGDTLARVGHSYTLSVISGNDRFVSETTMQPSVVIDSLTQFKQIDGLGSDSVIRAEFWAKDNFGRMDYYWIRTYRNGVFNNKPSAILTAQQAAFGNGDGFYFIVPYRQGINDFNSPYLVGERVKVEIYGINESSYSFLNQAQSQMVNGGLFATPPYNVKSNIRNLEPNVTETSKIPVGWFEVAASSSLEVLIK